MRQLPTAPLAAGTLIAGYAVAAGTGSRPLGGVVLVLGGTCCAAAWTRRRGVRTAVALTGVELAAFALSHVLALAVGAWPSVLIVSALAALAAWVGADSHQADAGAAVTLAS